MTEPLCVVLPLDGCREPQPGDKPWKIVVRGECITVRHSDPATAGRATWRMPFGPTSALSTHLQQVASMFGGGSNSAQHFRVAFPPGFSAGDLVPAAGGGFRGLVQSGTGTSRIGGQVRLFPSGPGLRPVLGPALGLMALTVITEMAAAAEQDRHAGTGVPGSVLRKELGKVGGIGWDGFADAVRTAHLANHLDSRRLVLVAAEAQFRNPGSPLQHLRQAVEADMAERARDLQRLRTVLARLASTPLTISAWDSGVLPHLITDRAVQNVHTQALFAGLATAADGAGEPAWASTGFDAALAANGDVRILEPVT